MKEGHRSCSALSRRVGFIEEMPTGLGPRSGTCIKLEYKWLRVCGCRADADVDVDGVGVI